MADIACNSRGQPVIPINFQREVKAIHLRRSASLAAGASEVDTYTVPAGKQWTLQVFSTRALKPVGAASGTHAFCLNVPGVYVEHGNYRGVAYNVDMSAASTNISYLVVPAGGTVTLEYRNQTDAAQTNNRDWQVSYLEENVP